MDSTQPGNDQNRHGQNVEKKPLQPDKNFGGREGEKKDLKGIDPLKKNPNTTSENGDKAKN